jgi:AICAR transformylase/IMP cyclohydrolase PurH
VLGGLLVQERDSKLIGELKVLTDARRRKRNAGSALAYKAVKNTKSNAIRSSK